jgi:hypothetical protein
MAAEDTAERKAGQMQARIPRENGLEPVNDDLG